MGNTPQLTDEQKHRIKTGVLHLDTIANSQAVRVDGKLILNNGLVQYTQLFFNKDAKDDIDNRGNGDAYMSEALAAEVTAMTSSSTSSTPTNAGLQSAFELQNDIATD